MWVLPHGSKNLSSSSFTHKNFDSKNLLSSSKPSILSGTMKVSFNNGKAPDIRLRTFSFKKKEWPDEENFQKMKIEDANGGAEYSEKLRILSGREHPELFLLWLED